MLLQPRPRLLAQGLGGAAGRRAARAASRSSTCCRWTRARRSPRVLPVKRVRRRPLRVHGHRAWARSRRRRSPSSRGPRTAGIIAVDLDEGDYLIGAALTDGQHDVMLFSDGGKAVRFDEDDVRPMGRNARGVRGMTLGRRARA
ncbi:MAG: hypothetical protein MZV65_53030 [Chromatiales bacterium]|nr:hypothetical protein [Chromatiales bacterium]